MVRNGSKILKIRGQEKPVQFIGTHFCQRCQIGRIEQDLEPSTQGIRELSCKPVNRGSNMSKCRLEKACIR